MNDVNFLKEKNFQAYIVSIAKNRGWRVYHTFNSRRSEPGFPDLLLVRNRILYRELKTEKGRISPAQKAWGESLIEAGGDFKIWRPSMIKEIYRELK